MAQRLAGIRLPPFRHLPLSQLVQRLFASQPLLMKSATSSFHQYYTLFTRDCKELFSTGPGQPPALLAESQPGAGPAAKLNYPYLSRQRSIALTEQLAP